jgi:hypothetical protein
VSVGSTLNSRDTLRASLSIVVARSIIDNTKSCRHKTRSR